MVVEGSRQGNAGSITGDGVLYSYMEYHTAVGLVTGHT